jgi:hypothetical protein
MYLNQPANMFQLCQANVDVLLYYSPSSIYRLSMFFKKV